jgi:hypothetical protein
MRTFIALSSLLLASVLQVRAADHSPAQTEISDKQVSGDDVASRDQSNFEEHSLRNDSTNWSPPCEASRKPTTRGMS